MDKTIRVLKDLVNPFSPFIYALGAGYGTATDNGYLIVGCVVAGVITFGFWMKRNQHL